MTRTRISALASTRPVSRWKQLSEIQYSPGRCLGPTLTVHEICLLIRAGISAGDRNRSDSRRVEWDGSGHADTTRNVPPWYATS
jgi:hypothetical protein